MNGHQETPLPQPAFLTAGLPVQQEALLRLHGETMARTSANRKRLKKADAAVNPLASISAVPEGVTEVPQIEALELHLAAVRALKSHYAQLHKAMLGHIPGLLNSYQKEYGPIMVPKPVGACTTNGHDAASGSTATGNQGVPGTRGPTLPAIMAAGDAHKGSFEPAHAQADTEHPPSFREAEAVAVAQLRCSDASQQAGQSSLQAALKVHVSGISSIGSHERLAASAAAVDMDRRHALGTLCTAARRYYLHSTALLIGRASESRGEVDIDVTRELATTRVSRLQCFLEFDPELGFLLYNVGRQRVHVNGTELGPESRARLVHLSLIEIGGINFMFVANLLAMQRMCIEMPPCPQVLR